MLMVQSAFLEPGQDARRVSPNVVIELRRLEAWLELDGIEVSQHGDLAGVLYGGVTRVAAPRKKQFCLS